MGKTTAKLSCLLSKIYSVKKGSSSQNTYSWDLKISKKEFTIEFRYFEGCFLNFSMKLDEVVISDKIGL